MNILGLVGAVCVTGISVATIVHAAVFVNVVEQINNISFDIGGLE